MKHRFFCLILLASVTTGTLHCAAEAAYADGIAAIVNKQVITVFDIMRETQQMELVLRRQNPDPQEYEERVMALRKDVAKHLVDRALVYEEYKRREYELPRRFINERLDAIVVERANGDWQKFEDDLNQSGMSLAEFKERMEKQLAVDVIINQLVRRPAHVTPSEVLEFYEENKSLYREPSKVQLRIIAIKRDGKSEQELQAALEVVERELDAGREFAAVAQELSEDTSASRGGDVGWIDTASGRQEFISAVQTLDVGAVSDAVKLAEAVYLIQLADTRDAVQQSLDNDLRQKIEAHLLEQKREARYEEFIQQLRKKYYVKMYF